MHSHAEVMWAGNGPFDNKSLEARGLGKFYCVCGSIVTLDSRSTNLKRSLGKPVECSRCRNRRIAQEMEGLERHFLGIEEEEEDEW